MLAYHITSPTTTPIRRSSVPVLETHRPRHRALQLYMYIQSQRREISIVIPWPLEKVLTVNGPSSVVITLVVGIPVPRTVAVPTAPTVTSRTVPYMYCRQGHVYPPAARCRSDTPCGHWRQEQSWSKVFQP